MVFGQKRLRPKDNKVGVKVTTIMVREMENDPQVKPRDGPPSWLGLHEPKETEIDVTGHHAKLRDGPPSWLGQHEPKETEINVTGHHAKLRDGPLSWLGLHEAREKGIEGSGHHAKPRDSPPSWVGLHEARETGIEGSDRHAKLRDGPPSWSGLHDPKNTEGNESGHHLKPYDDTPPWSRKQEKEILAGSFLFDQMQPIMFRFTLTGSLPLKRDSDGLVKARLWSLRSLYCLCVYLGSLPLLLATGRDWTRNVYSADTFEEILMSQLFTVMLVPYLLIPLSFWLDARNIAKYFNSWDRFQVRHLRVTLQPLQLEYRRWLTLLVTVNLLVALTPVTVMFFLPPYLTVWQAPTVYFNGMLLFLPEIMYWRVNCNALQAASKSVAHSFKVSVEGGCSSHVVAEYKRLWLDLSRLVAAFGHSAHLVYGVNFLTSFCFVTSSLYGSIASLMAGNYQMLGLFGGTTFFAGLPFYEKCDKAHWTAFKVKADIERELQRLTSTTGHHPALLEELRSFLRVTSSSPPVISLGGYITVDRQMCQAVAATVVTYLIVLLQFQLSLPSSEVVANSTNITVTD